MQQCFEASSPCELAIFVITPPWQGPMCRKPAADHPVCTIQPRLHSTLLPVLQQRSPGLNMTQRTVQAQPLLLLTSNCKTFGGASSAFCCNRHKSYCCSQTYWPPAASFPAVMLPACCAALMAAICCLSADFKSLNSDRSSSTSFDSACRKSPISCRTLQDTSMTYTPCCQMGSALRMIRSLGGSWCDAMLCTVVQLAANYCPALCVAGHVGARCLGLRVRARL